VIANARLAATILIGLAGLAPASAADVIRLSTGEVLTGTVAEVTDTTVRFVHPLLGALDLPRASVTILPAGEVPVVPAAGVTPVPQAADAPVPAAAPQVAPPPAVLAPRSSFWKGWKGTVEAGINGSEGNTETLSARGAAGAKRTTDALETSAGVSYVYARDDGEKSKSRGEANVRNDWLFKGSKWGIFALGKLEYDEFQDWDWRASAFAGPSYTFVKNETTLLRGRAGAGVSYEFGGDGDEEINPEALLGGDFEHKFNDRQSVYATIDFLPSLSSVPDYRIDAKAGYQILIDPTSKTTFKVGIADRFDSDPGEDRKRNDLEYFMTLGWEF